MALPGFYLNALFRVNVRWLNSMRLMHIPMAVAIIGVPLEGILMHLFVNVWQMEMEGIAYAFTITSFFLNVMLQIYQNRVEAIKEALFFPTKETWLHWMEYSK